MRLFLVLVLGAGALVIPAYAAPKVACDLVDGDYIVSFKSGANVDKELKNVNGRQINPKFKYGKALNGFAGKLTKAEVCDLKNNPNVEDIELDGVMSIDAVVSEPALSWGLDRIDQDTPTVSLNSAFYTYNDSNRGTGVRVYVIDTGILTTHPDFGTRATIGFDAINPKTPKQDCNGHGTHVAGTIGGTKYGVAKNVTLVAVRVLDCQGSGNISGVIAGIDWVIQDPKRGALSIANLSLGGGPSDSLDLAINRLVVDNKVTTVIAAGNSSKDASNYSPSRVENAVIVAASNPDDSIATYSNYGSVIDVFAPGTNITSDWLRNGIKTISGTSMAAPHVTGVLALHIKSQSDLSTPLKSVPSTLFKSDKIKFIPSNTSTKNFLIFKPSNL